MFPAVNCANSVGRRLNTVVGMFVMRRTAAGMRKR